MSKLLDYTGLGYFKDKIDGVINPIKRSVDNIADKTVMPVIKTGKYIVLNGSTVGNEVASSSWSYIRYPVTPGDWIIVNGETSGGSQPRMWGFADSNGNILSISGVSVTAVNTWVEVPTNAAEVIIDSQDTSVPCYYVKKTNLTNLDERLADVEGYIETPLTNVQVVSSKYMSKSGGGKFTNSTSGAAIAFFQIKGGERYRIHIPQASNTATYSLAYADILGDSLLDEDVDEIESAVGTNTELNTVIKSAESHLYLLIGYIAASGLPTVYHVESLLERKLEGIRSERHTLKVLCFGNSFTQDSFNYAPWIVKGIAPEADLTICMAIIGGCKLVQHCANITGVAQTLNGTTYSPDVVYTYYQYINGANAWTAWSSTRQATAPTLLALDDWDIITFQQNGGANYEDYSTYYEPFLNPMFKALSDKVAKPIKIGWLLTHGSYATTAADCLDHWEGSADNTETLMATTPVSVLFPYGTAVQNLRTTNISVGAYGTGVLTADTAHLQEGIATLCASYSVSITLLKLLGYNPKGIFGEQTRPDLAWITGHKCPGTNYATQDVVEGVTDDNCYLAQFAAIAAEERPYAVTTIV